MRPGDDYKNDNMLWERQQRWGFLWDGTCDPTASSWLVTDTVKCQPETSNVNSLKLSQNSSYAGWALPVAAWR